MMLSHGEKASSREVEIVLPNNDTQNVFLHQNDTTVYDLKIACEGCFGIPTKVQQLLDSNGDELDDHSDIISITHVQLQVPIWWHKCICSVLNNQFQNVYRRVQLPMQHVGRDERIFVALFMGCCRGMDKFVSVLIQLEHNMDINTSTDSGRTLLHACALGGDVKCLDIIVKHLLKSPSGFVALERLDKNKETAYQIAQKLENNEVAEQLLVYTNTKNKEIDFTDAPRQRQANSRRKINNCAINDERFGEKDKQNQKSNCADSIDNVNKCWLLNEGSSIYPPSNMSTEVQRNDTTPVSSLLAIKSPVDDDRRSPELSLRRPKEEINNLLIKINDESLENETEKTSLLPILESESTTYVKRRESRASSLPNTAITTRTGLFNEHTANTCQSAPNSPGTHRVRFAGNPYVNLPHFSSSRIKGRQVPFEPTPPPTSLKHAGEKWGHLSRRGSFAMNNNGPIRRERKSRSVCEVTFRECLDNQLFSMETEERLELPWNAWIAAKRQDSVQPAPSMLTPMSEESQLEVPLSPGTRRRSFVQWLTNKDLDQLRQQHEESQCKLQHNADVTGKKVKGKSFEEWLEDKHGESKKEKDKERELEEASKSEAEKKMRRRRMSEQKYQSWLQEKELKALDADEKLLGDAKQKFEKMKIKWEEDDELKSKSPLTERRGKVNVSRTKSCPSPGNSKISQQRFSSLHSK